MTATRPTEAPDVRRPHPVRRFVIVAVALALLAVVVGWSGAVNPRTSLRLGSGESNWATGEGYADGELTNHGPLPLDVRAVHLEGTDLRLVAATVDGVPLVDADLRGSESAVIRVAYRFDGCVPRSATPQLVVDVRTALGVLRPVHLRIDPFMTVPCP